MRIAYIGDFLNRGKSVTTTGSTLIFLLSELSYIDEIDVYCPNKETDKTDSYIPTKVKMKVKILETYDFKKPFSVVNLYKIKFKKYDLIIFNLMPTAFGRSSLMGLIGLMAPIVFKKMGINNICVIYHNSIITNDVNKLGYNSTIDKIKKIILSQIETSMFKNVKTYFPLKLYTDTVKKITPKNMIKTIDFRYFEGLTTIFLNKIDKIECVDNSKNEDPIKTVLLHGYWGPQKDLELALSTLKELKNEGLQFKLVISGGINMKFPQYKQNFTNLMVQYVAIIDERLGYVEEKDIYSLFLRADLVLIPYNSPGGHSGVLETAITFGKDVVCLRFPEYEEQARNIVFVKLCDKENFYETVKEKIISPCNRIKLNFRRMEETAISNVKEFISDACNTPLSSKQERKTI